MTKVTQKREDQIAKDIYEKKGALLSVADIMKFTGKSREFVKRNIVGQIQPVGSQSKTVYYFRDIAARIANNI